MKLEYLLENYDEKTLVKLCNDVWYRYVQEYKKVFGSPKNSELPDTKLRDTVESKDKRKMVQFIEKKLGEIEGMRLFLGKSHLNPSSL